MNDFQTDDAWQREQRDRYLLKYYRKHFNNFHFCDKLLDEQRRGIDTIIRIGDLTFTVDEKIVRKKYDAFALETKSCTIPGHEKPGWMFYGEADRLIYCFSIDGGLECHTINFTLLQKWFLPREKDFAPFQMESRNRTAGRVVPIRDVVDARLRIARFEIKGENP